MNESDLAEWRYNMSGRVVGIGRINRDDVEANVTKTFEGGFITSGTAISYSDSFVLREGMEKNNLARKYIAFAALPDDGTVLSIERAVAINRARTVETAALTFNIPNDIYNGSMRTIVYSKGAISLHGGDLAREFETLEIGNYACADGKIAIASKEPLTLVRREKRQIGLKETPETGTLYCEEISSSYNRGKRTFGRGEEIFTAHFAVAVGDGEKAKALSKSLSVYDEGNIRSVSAAGADGKRYLLIGNAGEKAVSFDIKKAYGGTAFSLDGAQRIDRVALEAWEAALLEIKD